VKNISIEQSWSSCVYITTSKQT